MNYKKTNTLHSITSFVAFLAKINGGRSYSASMPHTRSKKHPAFLTTINCFGEMLQTPLNRSLWLLREYKPNSNIITKYSQSRLCKNLRFDKAKLK